MNTRTRTLLKSIKDAIVSRKNLQRALYLGTGVGCLGFRSTTYSWLDDEEGYAVEYDGISAISVGIKEIGYAEWSINEEKGTITLDVFSTPNENVAIYLS